MQIKDGTCQIISGNAQVIADDGVDWSDAVPGVSWFSPQGSPNVYQIATTTAPGLSGSGNWELTVVGVISELSNPTQAYTIHKDFTPSVSLPMLNPGDTQTAQIMTRLALIVDGLLGSGVGMSSIGARVFSSINIDTANGVPLGIPFNTEDFDSDNCWVVTSPTRLTCRTAGKYIITGSVDFASNSTNWRQLGIVKNSTFAIANDLRNAVTGSHTQLTVSAIDDMAVGEWVELSAQQSSGGTLQILTLVHFSPVFAMVLVRGALAINLGGGGGTMDNPMTSTGDIIFGKATPTPGTPERLAAGSATQVLTLIGTPPVPTWAAPTSGGMTNPMGATGDIIIGGTVPSAGSPLKLVKGATGQVLTLSSTSPFVSWANPTPMTTAGDMIVGGASGAPARLASSGVSGYVLTCLTAGATPTWQPAAGGMANPMTAKGDIIIGNTGTIAAPASPSTPALLHAGTINFVLTSNGPDLAPSWKASPSGFANPMGQVGDMIICTAAGGTAGALAAGTTAGFVLTSTGAASAPSWQAPAGAVGQSYQPITVTNANASYNASGTTPGTRTGRHVLDVTVNTGVATNIADIFMPLTGGRVAGDKTEVTMQFPASASPTVNLRNNTAATTPILWQWTSDSVGRKAWVNFIFDGTNWKLQNSGFVT